MKSFIKKRLWAGIAMVLVTMGTDKIGAHSYDGKQGAWLSRDSSGESGLNLYEYVDNDPVNLWDPDGLTPKWMRERLELIKDRWKVIKRRMYDRQYFQGNKKDILERTRDYRKDYCAKNSESRAENAKEYRRNNRKAINETKREYTKNNREAVNKAQREAYARRNAAKQLKGFEVNLEGGGKGGGGKLYNGALVVMALIEVADKLGLFDDLYDFADEAADEMIQWSPVGIKSQCFGGRMVVPVP